MLDLRIDRMHQPAIADPAPKIKPKQVQKVEMKPVQAEDCCFVLRSFGVDWWPNPLIELYAASVRHARVGVTLEICLVCK